MTTTAVLHQQEGPFKIPPWVAPDVSSLLHVDRSEVDFGSSAISMISLPPGPLFARITSATYSPRRSYSSVQATRDADIELNSDLVFINHSCDPSLEFDMTRFEVRVVQHRPLHKGDELSFFYPSTEWDMAQPFDCGCGASDAVCLKRITGAKTADESLPRRYWLNKHIEDLLAERSQTRQ